MQNSQTCWPSSRHEKAAAWIESAVEQSERMFVPLMHAQALTIPQAVTLVLRQEQRRLLICHERNEVQVKPLLSTLLSTQQHASSGSAEQAAAALDALAYLIGPEGGFSEADRAHFANANGITMVSLGVDVVLRSETAAVACLAVHHGVVGAVR